MAKNFLKCFTILLCSVMISCEILPIIRQKKSKMQTVHQTACTDVGPNNETVLGFGNCQDYLYYIYLQVGTPPQQMGVQFDTGSNILWLPIVAGNSTPFSFSSSSTYSITSNPGSIQYADGSGVAGNFGFDLLTINSTTINKINCSFLWVNQQNSMDFPSGISGLVGMGYTTTPNFLDNAYSLNLIESPAFALQILQENQQSQIYFNVIPEQITNQTYMVPVVGNEYWQVQVIGVYVGGIDMTSSAANVAVIDSGTSYFYMNQNLFTNIVNQFFTNCDNAAANPICYCNETSNWPKFQFYFQGVAVSIEANAYTARLGGPFCTYLFGTLSTVPQILLGDIFFRSYIITFDKLTSQVGFAGNTTPLQPSTSNSTYIAQIAFIISISIIFVIGIFIVWCVQFNYAKFNGIDMTTGLPAIVQLDSFKTNKNQPFIGNL